MCQNCGRLVPQRFLNAWFDQDGSGVCGAETGRYTAANCRAHIQGNRERVISEAFETFDEQVIQAGETLLNLVQSPRNTETEDIFGDILEETPQTPDVSWFSGSSLEILRSMLDVSEENVPTQKRREFLGAAMQKLDEYKGKMPEKCYLDIANELKKVYDVS